MLIHQHSGFNPEGLCELVEDSDGGIAGSALDIAHIGAVDSGFISKPFLAPALLGAKAAQIAGEALTDIHRRC